MPIHLTFRPAVPADIPTIQDLAERIWRVSYAGMLTPAQIDYMLGRMYAARTIAAEMDRGVCWTLAERAGQPVGYLSLSIGDDETAELHKLYLLPEQQGGGMGQEMLQHSKTLASQRGGTALRLRVNKTNTRALKCYERAGFHLIDALVTDIGGGFVMDDYVLAVSLRCEMPLVKICGLSTPDTLEAALDAGTDWIGLVFFPKSPRHVSLDSAHELAAQARGRARIVALTVGATDRDLDAIVEAAAPDMFQLHGRETPDRAATIRARLGRPVMKALGVETVADLAAATPFLTAVDHILFDAKPPKDAVLPGGNGVAFDWTILRGVTHPFVLSGGLSPDNVAEAVRISGAQAVDVSSGVETAPGLKDAALIRTFVNAARGA